MSDKMKLKIVFEDRDISKEKSLAYQWGKGIDAPVRKCGIEVGDNKMLSVLNYLKESFKLIYNGLEEENLQDKTYCIGIMAEELERVEDWLFEYGDKTKDFQFAFAIRAVISTWDIGEIVGNARWSKESIRGYDVFKLIALQIGAKVEDVIFRCFIHTNVWNFHIHSNMLNCVAEMQEYYVREREKATKDVGARWVDKHFSYLHLSNIITDRYVYTKLLEAVEYIQRWGGIPTTNASDVREYLSIKESFNLARIYADAERCADVHLQHKANLINGGNATGWCFRKDYTREQIDKLFDLLVEYDVIEVGETTKEDLHCIYSYMLDEQGKHIKPQEAIRVKKNKFSYLAKLLKESVYTPSKVRWQDVYDIAERVFYSVKDKRMIKSEQLVNALKPFDEEKFGDYEKSIRAIVGKKGNGASAAL